MKSLALSVRQCLFGLRDICAKRPELLIFTVLIGLANFGILLGTPFQSLAFVPEQVQQGEWWRVVTHPLVHVTWYHLLLDGAAFLTLYASLMEKSLARRLGYVVAAAAGSFLLSWAAAPNPAAGLCGLSGIAHGLMAISAWEFIKGSRSGTVERRIGWISFALVATKAAFEALTGRMFFAFLDFGLLGTPVAVSHAGGIIGGLVAVLILNRYEAANTRIDNPLGKLECTRAMRP